MFFKVWYLVVRLKMSNRMNLSHLSVNPAMRQKVKKKRLQTSVSTEDPRLHCVALNTLGSITTLSYCNDGGIRCIS